MPSTNSHVFISYCRDAGPSQQWAVRLQQQLEARGYPCWRDETDVEAGRPWPKAIEQALLAADTVLCVIAASVHDSAWVEEELSVALREGKPIIPVVVEAGVDAPFGINRIQPVDFAGGQDRPLEALLARLGDVGSTSVGPRRRVEIAYLQDLLHRQGLADVEALYTALAGDKQTVPGLKRLLDERRMDMAYDLVRARFAADLEAVPSHPDTFDDVLDALRTAPRLAVLGEPGAGKTFSLRRIAAEQARVALVDPAAPIPLLVALKEWIPADTSLPTLEDFITRHLSRIGPCWRSLLEEQRATLLLDGLNELPTAHRDEAIPQIHALLADRRLPVVVVSCRRNDYRQDLQLELDTLTIRPLSPVRVHAFCHRYLNATLSGEAAGEDLFWHLAGGDEVRDAWQAWQAAGAGFEQFWEVKDLKQELPEVYAETTGKQDAAWLQARFDPRSLLQLARNPYLLKMLADLYLALGARGMPRNRAKVFDAFVDALLAREAALYRQREGRPHPGEAGLRPALGQLAWNLQTRAGGPQEVQLAVLMEEAIALLSNDQLDLAIAANLLEVSDTVRFSHQLLQEYFTARDLQAQVAAGTLPATALWPRENWRHRTGWEEAAVFLAGLPPLDAPKEAADPALVIQWLADAQPEVLAQCLLESGCSEPTSQQRADLQRRWLPRLEPQREPAPEGRHTVALALGRLELDNRPGLGLDERGLPDIDWLEVPGGEFLYGENNETRYEDSFYLARYPVTNAQYQAFIDAGGYGEDRWWEGLAERPTTPTASTWPEPNRPRTDLTWYEALAYCRWLSKRLGYPITLPTERQWEKAARGTDGREYPWGDGYQAGYANVDETMGKDKDGAHSLQQTSSPGLYPQGASPYGIVDMAGNVWEWCLNEYDAPDNIELTGDKGRVLRGGSWGLAPDVARCADRDRDNPVNRSISFGFRVLCSSPIVGH
jgi:formylglycine-generating enzyme required for sulfatase activity